MTCSRGAHDAILAKENFSHTVRSSDFDNELHDLRVVVTAIAANDKKTAIGTLRD